MLLGFTTSDNLKAIEFATEVGFDCLEFNTGPGFARSDLVNELDSPGKIADFKGQIDDCDLDIGSIITLLNPMAADSNVAAQHMNYFKKLIVLAGELEIPLVSSTSGQNPSISLDENVKLFGRVYRELSKVAEDSNVRIVFENCLHGYPAGLNIVVNPQTWEKVFNEVDTPTLGLEFDPSHLVFQFIDPVEAAREFVSKIYIVHGKDTEILEDELARGGIHSLTGYWRYRLPGYGDVDWQGLFQVLREGGFDGNVVIEHEDPVFHGDRMKEGLVIGGQYPVAVRLVAMNARERALKALKGEPVDRVPVDPLIMTFAARFAGVPYRSYACDYRVLVDAQCRTAEAFDIDCVTLCSDPCREAADCGARIRWFPDQPPTTNPGSPLVREKGDILKLRIPDPLGGGRMHDRVKGTALLREKIGDEKLILGWVEGPIAQAADIQGLNEVMLDLVDDPLFVRDLFEFIVPMEIDFAKAQIEAGADMIGIGDAAASLVGPRFYRDHILEYEKRLVDAIRGLGVPVRLHICGNVSDILGDIAQSGVDMIDIDFLTDLKLAREKLGPDLPILGNLDPVACLLLSTPEDIKRGLARCRRIAGERFFVGAGCEVPPDTPHENLRAMVEYSAHPE